MLFPLDFFFVTPLPAGSFSEEDDLVCPEGESIDRVIVDRVDEAPDKNAPCSIHKGGLI